MFTLTLALLDTLLPDQIHPLRTETPFVTLPLLFSTLGVFVPTGWGTERPARVVGEPFWARQGCGGGD